MKKACFALSLLLLFCLQTSGQGGKLLEKKQPTQKVGSISTSNKANRALAEMMASLPTKTFNINGRKTRVTLVAVDNPGLKKVGGMSGGSGIIQKSKKISANDGADKYCETYQMTLSAASEDFDVPYSTQASYIYPGAAYMYDDYYSNTVNPKRLTWARNPIYLQAASSSAFGEAELVQNPTNVNLESATGKIKKSLPVSPTNASISIKMLSIYDETDFRFKVNAGGGGIGIKTEASFGISNNSNKSYFMIDVIQSMYTINATLPANDTATFFKEPEKNKTQGALFMSSVTYGRRVLGVVETEFESKEMLNGFKTEYSSGFAGGSLGLDMLNGMKQGKTTVKLFIAGGDANAIMIPSPTVASVQAVINNFLRNGTSQNAVPVKFTFRDMSMSAMRYESATDKYTNEQCTPKMDNLKYKATVTLQSVQNETSRMEEVKFGLVESVLFYKNDVILNVDDILKPIVNWGGGKGFGINGSPEEPRTFTNMTTIDRSLTQIYSQNEIFKQGARVDLKTTYIAMFATRVFGQTNSTTNAKTEKVYLKDVLNSQSGGGSMTKEVRINFNNRVFILTFLISVVPV